MTDIPIEIVYTQPGYVENGSIGDLLVGYVNDFLTVNGLTGKRVCPRGRGVCRDIERTVSLQGEHVLKSEFPTDYTSGGQITITASWSNVLDDEWADEASEAAGDALLVIVTAGSETQDMPTIGGAAYGGVIWVVGWNSVNTTAFVHEFAHIAGAKHTDTPDRLMNAITSNTYRMTNQTVRSIIEYFRKHGIVSNNP